MISRKRELHICLSFLLVICILSNVADASFVDFFDDFFGRFNKGITGNVVSNGQYCTTYTDCEEGSTCGSVEGFTAKICCPSSLADYGVGCCLTDADCDSFWNICDTNVFKCYKQLLGKGEVCSSGMFCQDGLSCINNVCCAANYEYVCCNDDADCVYSASNPQEYLWSEDMKEHPYVCGTDYYCVKDKLPIGTSCTENSDCETEWCSKYVCTVYGKVGCRSDSYCGFSKSRCNSEYYCEGTARIGEDCGAGWSYNTCGEGVCEYATCCKAGEKCCREDSHCNRLGSGYICGSAYYCIKGTRASASPTPTTSPTTKYSNGHACTYSSDCDSNNCQNSVCCSYGETCCSYDYECGENEECSSSYYYCVAETDTTTSYANGHACTYSSECSSGNCQNSVCCESGQSCCAYNSECSFLGSYYECSSSYYFCVSNSGITTETTRKATGEYCSSETECESGRCSNGVCCSLAAYSCCQSQSDCGEGYECQGTSCVLKRGTASNGVGCSSSSDCESGNCGEGVCCSYGENCCRPGYDNTCGEGKECSSRDYYCVEKTVKNEGEVCKYETDCGEGFYCAKIRSMLYGACKKWGVRKSPEKVKDESELLQSFYENYDISNVYNIQSGKFVRKSLYYDGLAGFYKDQAEKIDVPVANIGKFVLVLDDISDLTRSVVGLNPIGFVMDLKLLSDDLSTKVTNSDTVMNMMAENYAMIDLGLEIAGESKTAQAGFERLIGYLPGNKIVGSISKRRAALKEKILPTKEAANQLFLIEVADLVIEKTLMADVKAEYGYVMFDYTQKIQLSALAKQLANLYRRAERHGLTDLEAIALMNWEKEFWTLVIARNENQITFEQNAGFLKRNLNTVVSKVLSSNYQDNIESAQDLVDYAQGKLNKINANIGTVFSK